MRMLIAEDDFVSRMLLKALLEKSGHQVAMASDGAEALHLLAGDDPPRLAILDWIMPGATGIEVCRRVRAEKNLSGCYLILLTSNNRKEDIIEGLQAGADDYIAKPFDHDELRARVNVGVRVIELQEQLSLRLKELETSLANVKRLRGLVPICCHCKKVRDDRDFWHGVEEYIEELGDVQFSHGVCPECLEMHYPGLSSGEQPKAQRV